MEILGFSLYHTFSGWPSDENLSSSSPVLRWPWLLTKCGSWDVPMSRVQNCVKSEMNSRTQHVAKAGLLDSCKETSLIFKTLWFLTFPTTKSPFPLFHMHTSHPHYFSEHKSHFTSNSKKLLFYFPFLKLLPQPNQLFNYFSFANFNFTWNYFTIHLLIFLVY